jgi:AmmeMemoRadiSam system protein A
MPPSHCVDLNRTEQTRLLGVARQSIQSGLVSARPLQIDLADCAESLRVLAAVFVTLTRDGELRGCIGSLQAVDPLLQAIANSAFNAAFRDRRFAQVDAAELDDLRIEISVLSRLEMLVVSTRQALLESLRPGVDGLLIEDRGRRSTFLPQVWEKIPEPQDFVEQLMLKAGLAADHWSCTIRVQRYQSLSFADN